ncbi:MAG TPA: metalloregulator ArsR/SmtB family transcription factor [Fimbriimonadales bacterium]|jgi:ArsR family transcriptional regulator|nr:metalloregulator ArsR/SmtB family transcription factor [Fimbriimonadales bacterium]
MLQTIGKALADESRIRIICALAHSDACVCELSDALDMPQSSLSNHLTKMRDARILDTTRDGTWIYYRLANPKMLAVLEAFAEDIRSDPRLSKDQSRLQKRLDMRIDGKCLRSYGQLKETK